MTTLRAINIGVVFDDGFAALSGIDLDVAEGEFVTLLGPSGCGKTTLLKTLAGFYRPSTGRIEIGGRDVTADPPERRDTAMCFQSYALFPHLSVAENIDFGPRQKGVGRGERAGRLAELLRQVDLEAHRAKLPGRLSGGQQQRVALARALAIRPQVVLFDEPLSNLDAKLRVQVRHEIRNLQRQAGFTAVYVTHDQAEALAMSDRVVVMRAGRVDQIGAPETVYRRPATAFVADFIGAANLHPIRFAAGRRIVTDFGPLELAEPALPGATHLCWRPEEARPASAAGADSRPAAAGPTAFGPAAACPAQNGAAPAPDPAEDDGAGNVLAGVVRARAFQGAFTELHVALDPSGTEVRLHLHGPAPGLGERLRFRLPPAALWTFADPGA